MGKTIVSWSPVHGQGSTTSNTVALASTMALDQSFSSLLAHTQSTFSQMDAMYRSGKNNVFEDGGIVALERLVKSKLLKPDSIPDYTETIYSSRLDFLPGKKEIEGMNQDSEILKAVFRAAKLKYDFLWIDAMSGQHSNLSLQLINHADLVLVNLPQNKHVIEQFFDGTTFPKELQDKKYFVIISQYDEKSNYSLRNIKRQHKVKVPMFTVNYETGFRDAVNQESVSRFFVRATTFKKGDPLNPFGHSLRTIINSVLKEFEFTELEDEWS